MSSKPQAELQTLSVPALGELQTGKYSSLRKHGDTGRNGLHSMEILVANLDSERGWCCGSRQSLRWHMAGLGWGLKEAGLGWRMGWRC